MTKIFSCTLAIFLLIKVAGINTASTQFLTTTASEMTEDHDAGKAITSTPGKDVPMNMGSHGSSEKGTMHTPAIDETAHIHHFHKHRIKKMKKHHGKCWLLSQLILAVCHLAILYIGYLHLVAH